MKISLDKLICDTPTVVHIPSQEAGGIFLEEMRKRFPNAVKTWTRPYFENYRIQTGGNFYYPRLHLSDPRMTHSDKKTYEEMGCSFVEFEDLVIPEVELRTEMSDKPVEFLFM